MKDCKECQWAIYCYSEPSSWIFRTKEQMEETKTIISACPTYQQRQDGFTEIEPNCSQYQTG